MHVKITVFGATGGIGGHVLRQALDPGHHVTAVVRDRSQFELRHPALEVVRVPGLTEPGPLTPALDGSNAVISAVGPRGRKDGPVATDATRVILHAIEAADVRRFVAVSAAPVARPPDGDSFINRRLLWPFITTFLRDTYADLAEMERLIRQSTTEWTVVRPPKLTNKALTRTYRTALGTNVPRGYSISRADTAHAILAALNDPATIKQPIGVAY